MPSQERERLVRLWQILLAQQRINKIVPLYSNVYVKSWLLSGKPQRWAIPRARSNITNMAKNYRGDKIINKRDWTQYIGKRFGRLEVIDTFREKCNNRSETRFLCRCDCGNLKKINAYSVIRGISRSCGCLEIESRFTRKHTEDLSGQHFDDLTIICDTGKRAKNGSAIWECRCSCGSTTEASSGDLKRGRVTNCGCKKVHANTKDISGMKFGKLTVLHIDRSSVREKGDRLHWICKCDCGNLTSVATNALTRESTLSCGCSQMSGHEQIISSILKSMNIEFVQQKRFDDCRNIRPLPFDFYIPEKNIAIEYDGRQHVEAVKYFGGIEGLERRKINDAIKDKYCKENNIELIRLPYTMSSKEIRERLEMLETRNE